MALSASTAQAACISEANPLDSNREYFSSVGRITAEGYATGADDVVVAEDFSVHYDTYFKVVKTLCGRHAPAAAAPPPTSSACAVPPPPPPSPTTPPSPPTPSTSPSPSPSVGVGQSTPVTYLEMLGLRDAIKIIDPQHVHSPCLQKLEEEGSIDAQYDPYGGADEWAAAIAAMPSIDAVFTDSWGTAGTGTDKDIVFDASNDPGALARAEWIKLWPSSSTRRSAPTCTSTARSGVRVHLCTRRHRRRLHRQEVRVGDQGLERLRPRLHDVQDGVLPRRGDDTRHGPRPRERRHV